MDNPDLDKLQQDYKQALNEWVAAIREEEGLASGNHSMIAMEQWERAGFKRQDAGEKALQARQSYEDGLRKINYGI